MLRATTVTLFSTSQFPKVVRELCALHILTWTCASRHNFFDALTSKSGPRPSFLTLLTWKCASRHKSPHFFDISTSKSGPRMVRFAHFDLGVCFAQFFTASGWKNAVHCVLPTFSRTCIFFLVILSLFCCSLFCSCPPWLFPPLLFHLSMLSEV